MLNENKTKNKSWNIYESFHCICSLAGELEELFSDWKLSAKERKTIFNVSEGGGGRRESQPGCERKKN